jgi:chaperone modulatory protein CbpM
MMDTPSPASHDRVEAVIVEQHLHFTLTDLGRACRAGQEELLPLVEEGVLQPEGHGPEDWLFGGLALQRARAALRLSRELELNPAGTALVLDLLDEVGTLRARLRRLGEA